MLKGQRSSSLIIRLFNIWLNPLQIRIQRQDFAAALLSAAHAAAEARSHDKVFRASADRQAGAAWPRFASANSSSPAAAEEDKKRQVPLR